MFGLKEWDNNLSFLKGNPIKILDIGIYKGIIMKKFIDNFLKNNNDAEYYGIDTKNQIEGEYKNDKVKIILDLPNKILPELLVENHLFDLIYFNTNYLEGDILYMLIMAFKLLNNNGIIIINDYLLSDFNISKLEPKIVIDALINIYKNNIDILSVGYQIILKKVIIKITNITKTEEQIINRLISKLNEYWEQTEIREYNLLFNYKEKIPEVKPKYMNFSDIMVREVKNDIFSKMFDVNLLYKYKSIKDIDDEIKDKNIYIKLNKLNSLVKFNNYQFLYLINDLKIKVDHLNNKKIYVVNWGENMENYLNNTQERYNIFFGTVADIYGIDLLKYSNNEETLDELINRIKNENKSVDYFDAKNLTGKISDKKLDLHHMYNFILVQILIVNHVLKEGGSFKILIEENLLFINDFIFLLNIIFEKVRIYIYSTKIGRLSLRIIGNGFLGINNNLYNSIYEAIKNANKKEIISLFSEEKFYINYQFVENNIFEMYKNIASIIEKNFNLIENNIKTINMTIARRTLDDIFKYLIKNNIMKGGMNYFPSNNDKILIDDVGKYSITKPDKTHIIIDIIIKTMQTDKLVITDGTACIGGDTLAFSEKFTSVNSVELDKTRYEYLKHNMDIFGRKNISFFNDSYLNIYSSLKQDVIYLDPPWGGPEYKDKKYVTLKLGDMKLEDLCRNIINEKLCKLIILKLPFNYDLTEFKKLHRFKSYNLHRILIITFKLSA